MTQSQLTRLVCDRCDLKRDFDPNEGGADDWLELSIGAPKLGHRFDERDLDICPPCRDDFEMWLSAVKLRCAGTSPTGP